MDPLQSSSNWDPLTLRLTKWDQFLYFSIGPTYKCSSHWNEIHFSRCYSLVKLTHCNAVTIRTYLQYIALRNGTHLISLYNFPYHPLIKISPIGIGPTFRLAIRCDMDPLQCRSNWDPLTSRLRKWDPLNMFYNFSYDPLIKTPPIGMGPTLHRDVHLWKGPSAMKWQLGPTYTNALRNGTHLISFYNFP